MAMAIITLVFSNFEAKLYFAAGTVLFLVTYFVMSILVINEYKHYRHQRAREVVRDMGREGDVKKNWGEMYSPSKEIINDTRDAHHGIR